MAKKNANIIYALLCPITDEVHYVGKSSQGLIRPFSHLSKSHSEKIQAWAKDLSLIGLKPLVKVLEYVDDSSFLNNRESYHIEKYKSEGNNLLNIANVYHKSITVKSDAPIIVDNNPIVNISEFVKTKRRMFGYSQPEFAKKAGVGLRFLRDLEQGKKKTIRMDKVNTVLFMFGCKAGVVKI